MKNNFWIFKPNNEILILHEDRCPLDYCTDKPREKLSLSDLSNVISTELECSVGNVRGTSV